MIPGMAYGLILDGPFARMSSLVFSSVQSPPNPTPMKQPASSLSSASELEVGVVDRQPSGAHRELREAIDLLQLLLVDEA